MEKSVLQPIFRQLLDIPGDTNTVRRGRTLILISLVLMGAGLLAILYIILYGSNSSSSGGIRTVSFFAIVSFSLLMGLTVAIVRRGMQTLAAWLLIICQFATLIAPIFLQSDNTRTLFYLIVPLVASGLILQSRQVSLVTLLGLLIILAKLISIPAAELSQDMASSTFSNSTILLIIVGAISQLGAYTIQIGFSAAEAANKLAADTAANLAQLNAELEGRVEVQTNELRRAISEVQAQANEKQALLDEVAVQRAVISEMSVPVLPVSDDTLVMPLVGELDSSRLETIQSRALAAIESSHARTLLIDLTGVAIVDTYIAKGLLQTVQSARLLGTTPVLIGIRPEVAQSIVSLGIDLGEVRTAASLASALRR